ncbi:MAG: 2-dehydro-3-deoxygalactonokinase [Alphaproteobacteria bacterium]|nr:2-dehydro-3-deoxygalactonokinase [Alphaproteobacteria bacterium]
MTRRGALVPDWIAADWGTSNLRLWAMRADGAVLARSESQAGMGVLSGAEAFEAALLEGCVDWLPPDPKVRVPVIACGMVGAREGWINAPYSDLASLQDHSDLYRAAIAAPVVDPRLDVRILPGLKRVDPADVMRGEETQLGGFLMDRPGYDGLVCLPGTHSKWVRLKAGRIADFHTLMTGELFALLSRQSILRHTLSVDGDDPDQFTLAVVEASAKPLSALDSLFGLRASALVSDLSPSEAGARLSGLLLGAELAAVRDRHGAAALQSAPIVLIGVAALSDHYRAALKTIGVKAEIISGEDLALKGLTAAHAILIGERAS